MRAAARIGAAFGMDPVAVLEERVTLRTQIRIAALIVAQRDQAAFFGGGGDD